MMENLKQKVDAEVEKLVIDIHMFDPVLSNAGEIRKELDDLLRKSKPKKVGFEMTPEDHEKYGVMFREVVLPHLLIKSAEYGYKIFIDNKAYENARIQFGRYLGGNKKEGYYFPK